MSVTFAPEIGEVVGYSVGCICQSGATIPAADEAAAHALLGEVRRQIAVGHDPLGCTSTVCIRGVDEVVNYHHSTEDAPSLNVNNQNANAILAVLGYVTTGVAPQEQCQDLAEVLAGVAGDYNCGSAAAEDFLGRVLISLAFEPDVALTPTTRTLASGAVVHSGGRTSSYLGEKLAELRDIAEYARSRGIEVQWS